MDCDISDKIWVVMGCGDTISGRSAYIRIGLVLACLKRVYDHYDDYAMGSRLAGLFNIGMDSFII